MSKNDVIIQAVVAVDNNAPIGQKINPGKEVVSHLPAAETEMDFLNEEKYRMIYYREKLNFQVLDQDLVQRIFTWIVILVALLILNSPDNIWEVKLNLLEEPCPMICPFKDHLMLILQI